MSTVVRITIRNIPEHLEPGDKIECTIDDTSHDCEFVRYGMSNRFLWARIHGLREISNGILTTQLDMFSENSFTTEFVVNDAPGRTWHRAAGMTTEIER